MLALRRLAGKPLDHWYDSIGEGRGEGGRGGRVGVGVEGGWVGVGGCCRLAHF